MEAQSRGTSKRSALRFCFCRLLTSALLLSTFIFLVAASAWPQAPLTVGWRDKQLSVSAEKVPLAQILQEVARQTGLEIQGLEGLEEEVSLHFSALSLRAGLQQLLAQWNYLLCERPMFQEGTQPILVIVAGRRATASTEMAAGEGGTPPAETLVVEEDVEARLTALHAFAAQGNEAALRQAVSDPEQAIQETAFTLLGWQNPEEAATLAVAAAQDADPTRRLTGLQALGQLDGPLAVQALGEALTSDDVGMREYAVQGLMSQTTPEATRLLSQALEDQDPAIRLLALETLAPREAEGREVLNAALHSGDTLVRVRARELLEQMRTDEEEAPPVVESGE